MEIELGLEPKVVGHVSFNHPVTAWMINDILTNGMDDGIGYWCEGVGSVGRDLGVGPGLHLGEGGVLGFRTHDGIDGVMTLATFLSALQRHCQEKGWTPEEMWEQGDDKDADVIIQYALFNRVAYP